MHHDDTILRIENSLGNCRLRSGFYICPNPKCKKFSLALSLERVRFHQLGNIWEVTEKLHVWNLLPRSKAQSYPDYVPAAVKEDYNEACLVKDLSPKASATLSRRCLQGILRDFWKVKPGRLVDEIDAIKDKIDPLTWSAIEAVRKVGNIGAHMEKDINLIVDVEVQEAELLIGLIEVLIKDWYVARENRQSHLNSIIAVASQKERDKQQKPVATVADAKN